MLERLRNLVLTAIKKGLT